MIIVDTNVVSEFMRETPDAAVLVWAQTFDPAELWICVVTIEEIERGLGRLPKGGRRRTLEARWSKLIDSFASNVAGYDVAAARATANVQIDALERGQPVPLADAQIAGICLSLSAQLATRNVRDFTQISGLAVVNPFEATPPLRTD